MEIGYIKGFDFCEMEPMRYWSPPASWTEEKKKTTVRDRIFSNEWVGAEKKDGFFMKFVKDDNGNQMLLSRSRNVQGVFPNKIEWVPHLQNFFDAIPCGTCLLGEVYLPNKPGSNEITKILGCLKDKAIARQSEEKLHFYVFDILAFDGKNWVNAKAADRFENLKYLGLCYENCNKYVSFATYKNGKELWDYLQNVLAAGGEGIVLWNKNGKYEPGKRPSKTTMKVKKELRESIDCFFTGHITLPTKLYSGKEIETWPYWYNNVTDEKLPVGSHYYESYMEGKPYIAVTKPYYNGWAGSLEIGLVEKVDGRCRITTDSEWVEGLNIVSIGYISGLTDEVKANYRNYIGKVIEVGAMQLTPDGDRLRHGKMLGWRPDKVWTECSIDQLKEL
ncbi:MAG: hypothetical protein LIR50_07410 [Bacillota bacterium]|nr:hypothetical protein [Bacillota bacterium]